MEIQEQVKEVERLRGEYQRMKEYGDKLLADFRELHKTLFDDTDFMKNAVTKEETKLREMAVSIYSETQDKHPAPGVDIRVMERFIYDPDEAFGYALNHAVALKLDESAFKKMCKISELRPAFVKVEEEPTATIATDLSKVLNEEK